ncbi:Sec16 Sec23-binding domain-containing protein [Entamoeba marina]
MSKTASLEKRGTLSWSPTTNHIAIGTTADTIDEDFDSSSYIEIYEVSSQAKLIKKVSALNRFYKLTWGSYASYPKGIIAVSNDDLYVVLYDVQKILSLNEDDDVADAEITSMKTNEIIYDIEFHPSQPQLVCGGANGEFILYDITDVENVKTTTLETKQTNTDIYSVNWNIKVPHIIALTLSNGSINIMTFSDKQHGNWKGARWVPTEKTLLITISDSSERPVQLWDVRNTMAPVKIYEGHNAPVWSISWSKTNPNIFATAGQDKTSIWNYETGKIMCEFTCKENAWDTCVSWSALEGRFCTAGLDGFINFYTISDFGEGKYPNWMVRSAGVAFGFAGKQVIFNGNKAIQSMGKEQVEEYCVAKENTSEGMEKEEWKLIGSLVCDDKNAIVKACENGLEDVKEKSSIKKDEDDDEDPFAQLGEDDSEKETEEVEQEQIEETQEDQILSELIISNQMEKAIEFCLKTKRYADALIISEGNTELHTKVVNAYKLSKWSSLKSLSIADYVLKNDLTSFVDSIDLNDWKVALFAIQTHSSVALRPVLTVALGNRLFETDKHAALMCYIAAGNIQKLLDIWIESTKDIKEVVERIEVLRVMSGNINLTEAICAKIISHATQLASVGELNAAQKLIECLGNQQTDTAKELIDRIYYASGSQGTKPQSPYSKIVVGHPPKSTQPQPTHTTQPTMPVKTQFMPTIPTATHPTMPATMAPTMPTMPAATHPTMPATVAPVMPTIPKPTMPTTTAPVMPTLPKPTMPTIPTTTHPTMPATAAPIMPTIPTTTHPTMPATTAPVMPKPAMPTIPSSIQPTMPATTAPTMPKPIGMPTHTTSTQSTHMSSVVDRQVCEQLKNVLGKVTGVAMALKKVASFEQCIDRIPVDFANQFINIFNDLLDDKITEADTEFKKILVNKQISEFVPNTSIVSIKYLIDASKQLK